MYSTNNFIQFVFADYTDLYYTRSLQTLKLYEYLWYDLHNSSYNTVYYLTNKEKEKHFSVSTYGDKDSHIESFNGLSPEKKFEKWLCREMFRRPDESCAIVCPLKDFCSVMEQDKYRSVLESLVRLQNEQKRTGIIVLVASKYAEDSIEPLLKSPVFDFLNTRGDCLCRTVANIRRKPLCKLYDELKRFQNDSCMYLNQFNEYTVKTILIQVFMRNSFEKSFSFTAASKFIMQGIFAPETLNGTAGLKLNPDMQFIDLYNQLNRSGAWKKLSRAVQSYSEEDYNAVYRNQYYRIPIFRKNDVIKRCLSLSVQNESVSDPEGHADTIRAFFASPYNHLENPEVLLRIDSYLNMLYENFDADYYGKILFSIKCCTKLIYTDNSSVDDSSFDKILESLDLYVQCVEESFFNKKQLAELDDGSNNKLAYIIRKNFEDKYFMFKKMFAELEPIIRNCVLNVSSNKSFRKDELNDVLKGFQKTIEDSMNDIENNDKEYKLILDNIDSASETDNPDKSEKAQFILQEAETEPDSEETESVSQDNPKDIEYFKNKWKTALE